MIPYGPFDLTVGANGPFETQSYPTVAQVVILNESPYTLRVNTNDGNIKTIAAFAADLIIVAKSFDGRLDVTASADLNTQGASPAMILYIETYGAQEQVPGTYPAPLARLVSVGNQVGVSSTLTQIINAGEATPNDVIKDTPAGYTNPTIHLINTGELHITPETNGGQADALAVVPGAGVGSYAKVQVDAGLITSDGKGGWSISGFSFNEKDSGSPAANTFATDSPAGAGRRVYIRTWNGSAYVDTFRWYEDGTVTSQGGYRAWANSWLRSGWSRFSGTGSGTYSHGMGATPSHVTPVCSQSGSQTQGWDSANSSTVHITCGASLSFTAEAIGM